MAHNIYYILSTDRENFEKTYKKFIHELIWDSNMLDGFEVKEVKAFEEQLNNPVFRTEMVQKLGEMIYEKLFTEN